MNRISTRGNYQQTLTFQIFHQQPYQQLVGSFLPTPERILIFNSLDKYNRKYTKYYKDKFEVMQQIAHDYKREIHNYQSLELLLHGIPYKYKTPSQIYAIFYNDHRYIEKLHHNYLKEYMTDKILQSPANIRTYQYEHLSYFDPQQQFLEKTVNLLNYYILESPNMIIKRCRMLFAAHGKEYLYMSHDDTKIYITTNTNQSEHFDLLEHIPVFQWKNIDSIITLIKGQFDISYAYNYTITQEEIFQVLTYVAIKLRRPNEALRIAQATYDYIKLRYKNRDTFLWKTRHTRWIELDIINLTINSFIFNTYNKNIQQIYPLKDTH